MARKARHPTPHPYNTIPVISSEARCLHAVIDLLTLWTHSNYTEGGSPLMDKRSNSKAFDVITP